jgi:xanthine dehydrogenase molybdopterin-binding subunit B
MAPQFNIDHNIAEAGATQINNVNVSTSTQNPLDPQDMVLEIETVSELIMVYRL